VGRRALGSAAIGGEGGDEDTKAVSGMFGSSPSQRGWRQMITAIPHAVTSSNIATKAASFCFIDGPRARTTIVGVLARRGTIGRSGMRTVICAGLRGLRPCGV
jgi:hypothetical protein